MNLFYSYNLNVEHAYIITVKGNESSEKLSNRCQDSCKAVGMPFIVWDAFDGIGSRITIPDHSKNETVTNIVKVTDHYLTRGEVACALSHISLWAHCALIDKPIVILEHDAVMVRPFTSVNTINSIVYLGGIEWAKQNWKMYSIPPHASEGPNYHFICRAHAYAIDPVVAKNMLAYVLKMGIHMPLDMMLRTDIFNVTHQGLFAFDDYENNDQRTQGTTIKARPIHGRTTTRNDNLES